jgi:hypothetical protein
MVMPVSRAEIVRTLVEYALPIEPVIADLSGYPWDCDAPLFLITPTHVASVLDRYLAGDLTAEHVEHWGNLVEGRDDLDSGEDVSEVIHELANPLLTQPLSKESALRMRHALATSTI